jgi:hypothetical protein
VEVATKAQLGMLNVPVELEVKLMLPVGVMSVPTSVSVTVAVQLVAVPLVTGLGEQFMVIEVARLLTITVALPLLML